MLSVRKLLIISSAMIISLILYKNINSDIPESTSRVPENKDKLMQISHSLYSRENDSVSTLRKEVQALKAEMNSLKLQNKSSHNELARRIDSQISGEYQESETNENEETTPDFVEQESIQSEQLMEVMETSLAEEQVDVAWSSSALDQIQRAFNSNELNGVGIIDLDCRKTLCRIEMDIDDPFLAAEYQLWLSLKIGDILPQASMMVNQDEEGHSNATLFLAREGYNLPTIN